MEKRCVGACQGIRVTGLVDTNTVKYGKKGRCSHDSSCSEELGLSFYQTNASEGSMHFLRVFPEDSENGFLGLRKQTDGRKQRAVDLFIG